MGRKCLPQKARAHQLVFVKLLNPCLRPCSRWYIHSIVDSAAAVALYEERATHLSLTSFASTKTTNYPRICHRLSGVYHKTACRISKSSSSRQSPNPVLAGPQRGSLALHVKQLSSFLFTCPTCACGGRCSPPPCPAVLLFLDL